MKTKTVCRDPILLSVMRSCFCEAKAALFPVEELMQRVHHMPGGLPWAARPGMFGTEVSALLLEAIASECWPLPNCQLLLTASHAS